MGYNTFQIGFIKKLLKMSPWLAHSKCHVIMHLRSPQTNGMVFKINFDLVKNQPNYLRSIPFSATATKPTDTQKWILLWTISSLGISGIDYSFWFPQDRIYGSIRTTIYVLSACHLSELIYTKLITTFRISWTCPQITQLLRGSTSKFMPIDSKVPALSKN